MSKESIYASGTIIIIFTSFLIILCSVFYFFKKIKMLWKIEPKQFNKKQMVFFDYLTVSTIGFFAYLPLYLKLGQNLITFSDKYYADANVLMSMITAVLTYEILLLAFFFSLPALVLKDHRKYTAIYAGIWIICIISNYIFQPNFFALPLGQMYIFLTILVFIPHWLICICCLIRRIWKKLFS